MIRKQLGLALATFVITSALSASADMRPRPVTASPNPITVESQIREIEIHGDDVVIRLERQPYEFVAPVWLRVHSNDHKRLYARDLLSKDCIHIEGDLDHDRVTINRVVLQLRIEHR